jgi:hypothetical protein
VHKPFHVWYLVGNRRVRIGVSERKTQTALNSNAYHLSKKGVSADLSDTI